MTIESKNSISIVLVGAAGQGIATVESLLTKVLKKSGLHVFSTSEFMSRVRGGTNSTTIRVSSERVRAYCDKIDILVPLSKESISHVKHRLTKLSCIIGDKKLFENEPLAKSHVFIDTSYEKVALEVGNRVYSNSVAVGLLAGLLQMDRKLIGEMLTNRFDSKGTEIVKKNLEAANRGCDLADSYIASNRLPMEIKLSKQPSVSSELFMTGRDAIALGAIAGGCNYVVFYPMAPSTGIGTFLAQNRLDFGIISDQTEDEISAVNKAFGAWYAGGRALVTTSGGGFALMTEGISLAGITEMPLVIHLGQRPGPATGMPTRTEQGDLELALYAGHGDFPRVIYAPGSLKEAFKLTQMAFNIADEWQVVVIILTDHYFINSSYNLPSLEHENLSIKKSIIETDEGYQRYTITSNGISPRGIPGYGDGTVRVDSHTHTEDSQITEDPEIRQKMVEKRLTKLNSLKTNALKPKLQGVTDYKTLVVSWGSTYHLIQEACKRPVFTSKKVAHLHFSQVYPLHKSVKEILQKAAKVIIVENNATAQFSKVILLETGVQIKTKILKYSGYSFSVEELVNKLEDEV
ncbi:MAG: 2-oxoacid:acceptor oxidoreductase subunit alpha [Candidatus Hodarchaeales archaeon]|jgi:2-oxoglutarate ferredoxin oxidoreductase subunit alpha